MAFIHGKFFLCFFYTCSLFVVVKSACYSDESCLYDALMTNYNKQVRPASGPGKGVDVRMTASIKNILALDEREETLSSVVELIAMWEDHYLTWDPSTYKIDEILINIDQLWIPDFAVINTVDKFYHTTFMNDFRGSITHNGTVTWRFGGVFKTTCSIDITNYPFDSQSCSYSVQNFAYKDKYVNITEGTFVSDDFQSNSLWTLESTNVELSTLPIENDPSGLPVATFTINLKRKTGYYTLNLITPITLLVISTLGVFWLPPDCGEKISLGVTILLAFSVFQIVIMDLTPVNSVQTPYLSKLVIYFMVMSTISMLSAMLAAYVFFKKPTSQVPRWIRIIAFKGLAKIVCLHSEVPSEENDSIPENNQTKVEVIKDEKAAIRKLTTSSNGIDIGGMLSEVKKITSFLKQKQDGDLVTDEWKLLAIIIDRMLFYISVVYILIAVIVTNAETH